MSFFYTFFRIIRSGFASFVRNGALTVATVIMLVISLSVVTSLFMFGVIVDGTVAELRDKVDISVYFKTDALEEDITKVKDTLAQFDAVTAVEYISREDALERFKDQHKDNPVLMESLAELGDNPLEASLNIKAQEASQYAAISHFLEGKFGSLIDKVNYRENEAAITRLFSVTAAVQRAGFVVSAAFIAMALLIAFNTIRLAIYSLREEIAIMRLVGASDWFIRGPFVVQGFLNGIIAAALTVVAFAFIVQAVSPRVSAFLARVDLWSYYQAHMFELFFIQAGVGIAVGVLSSVFAMRRYLRV